MSSDHGDSSGNFACLCFRSATATAVGVSLLYVGASNLGNCPAEPLLPVFVTSTAVLSLSSVLCRAIFGCLLARACSRDDGPAVWDVLTSHAAFLLCQTLLGVGWLCAGIVLLVRASADSGPSFDDPKAGDYCEYYTYWVTFGLTVAACSLVGLGLFCVCCFRLVLGRLTSS